MSKKNNQSKFVNNNNNKKEEMDKFREMAAKSKAKTAEEMEKKLIEKMGAEDAKLYMSQEEILKREAQLDKREADNEKKEEGFAIEEAELEKKKAEANEIIAEAKLIQETSKKEVKELELRKSLLDKKESDLLNKERELIERENNAENEFVLQNQKALEVLRKRENELHKEIEVLETQKIAKENAIVTEVLNIRNQKAELIDKEMNDLYESRKNEIDKKINQMLKASHDHITHEESLIGEQRVALSKKEKELNSIKISLDERKSQLDIQVDNLRFEQKMLDEEKKLSQKVIEQRIQEQVETFKYDLDRTRDDVKYYKQKLVDCEERITEYEKTERESGGQSKEELIAYIEELKVDNDRMRKEKALMPTESLVQELRSKAEDYDRLQRELSETRGELYDIRNKEHQWEKTTNLLQIEREKCDQFEKRREALEATLIKYSEEVNRFKSLYEQPKELSARLDAIKKPILQRKAFASANISEMEWLDKIYEQCELSGISFNKRLLYSFHTALKTSDWSPLTVLAGVSGTGKSLLPEYYCRYGGIHFMSMAVQPDWDSPQALFGYFNSVDNRFNATTLLRAMVQFSTSEEEKQKDTNMSDAMFMVLLDEMNLAHVELYFSDMLSKLERRRNNTEEVFVEIDLGAGMDKYRLELNNNVLWVGTMNEDETTKSLSDKVLDRGNLISFPRPTEFISRTKAESCEEMPILQKIVWNQWVSDSVIENQEFRKAIEEYKKALESVNVALEYAGRALGHRVWQSIENYMANHPKVIEAFKNNVDSKEKHSYMTEAFEEALVHKVMPKLRGIETTGEMKTNCLDKIREILLGASGLAPGLGYDFENAIKSAYETFLWKSAKYLEIEE